MLDKIKEWIGDNIIWYIWDKPKDYYRTVRHWWRCCGRNPWHWKGVWHSMFHSYPWDYIFFWDEQYYWIKKSQWYFENTEQIISDVHLNEIKK